MSKDIEDRVTALEMAVTHQEQTIHELSDVITEQWAQIEKLKRELGRLDETKADIEPEEDATRRPPHY
jgi:SlyX protein